MAQSRTQTRQLRQAARELDAQEWESAERKEREDDSGQSAEFTTVQDRKSSQLYHIASVHSSTISQQFTTVPYRKSSQQCSPVYQSGRSQVGTGSRGVGAGGGVQGSTQI